MVNEIVIKANEIIGSSSNTPEKTSPDIITIVGTSAALLFAIGGAIYAKHKHEKSKVGKKEDEYNQYLK